MYDDETIGAAFMAIGRSIKELSVFSATMLQILEDKGVLTDKEFADTRASMISLADQVEAKYRDMMGEEEDL
jgi:hypothetical protein